VCLSDFLRHGSVVPVLLSHPPADPWGAIHLSLGLSESFIPVSVIDERLQSEPRARRDEWARMGIHVVPVTLTRRPQTDRERLTAACERAAGSASILLIHQGVLEKVLGTRDQAENWAAEWSNRIEIVVTSDRAENRLEKLPRAGVRFLPYSALQHCLDVGSKYLLIRCLLNCKLGRQTGDMNAATQAIPLRT